MLKILFMLCLIKFCVLFQGAIGFELWSISDKIYFDNIIIADDESHAEKWSELTWLLKKKNLSHESVMF